MDKDTQWVLNNPFFYFGLTWMFFISGFGFSYFGNSYLSLLSVAFMFGTNLKGVQLITSKLSDKSGKGNK